MTFNSITFLLFFAVVMGLHYSPLPWTAKKINLLIASYIFYSAWNPPFVLVLMFSTLFDWVAARLINGAQTQRGRNLCMAASVAANLGLLGFFKYGAFLLANFVSALAVLGVDFHPAHPDIVLPIGISFYTFQSLSYTLGVYRRDLEPTPSLLDYALYVMLALVAFDLNWSRAGLRRLWVPLAAAAAGASIGAGSLALLGLLPARIAFATGFGFGWYTLTGALVAANAGAAFGFLAFLTNFLRENLTMVTSPWAGPVVGGEGMTAVAGATSMDTTLYFITHFADPEAGSLALASGLVLTITASIAVPLVLGAL